MRARDQRVLQRALLWRELNVERPAGDGEALVEDLPRYGFRLDDIAAGETRYRASSASKTALNTQEEQRVIGLVRQYIRGLKNSICEKAGLRLIRVRWGDWEALGPVAAMLGQAIAPTGITSDRR